MGFKYLSDEWFAEVKRLRESAGDIPVPDAVKDLVINIKVKGGPDGDRELRLEGGNFEQGLAASAPTTLTVPYDVARKMFIDQDQQAAMQAFMGGQIQVEGDMAKLMQMQAGGPPAPAAVELAKQIAQMTE